MDDDVRLRSALAADLVDLAESIDRYGDHEPGWVWFYADDLLVSIHERLEQVHRSSVVDVKRYAGRLEQVLAGVSVHSCPLAAWPEEHRAGAVDEDWRFLAKETISTDLRALAGLLERASPAAAAAPIDVVAVDPVKPLPDRVVSELCQAAIAKELTWRQRAALIQRHARTNLQKRFAREEMTRAILKEFNGPIGKEEHANRLGWAKPSSITRWKRCVMQGRERPGYTQLVAEWEQARADAAAAARKPPRACRKVAANGTAKSSCNEAAVTMAAALIDSDLL